MGSEWIVTTIESFSPFIYGKSLPQNKRNALGNVPVFGSNGIIGFHDKALTAGPSIVIGRKGTVGAIHYSSVPCWPIDTTFYIEDNDAQRLRFKYYLLKSIGLEYMNSDSAVPGLNREAAHARIIHIPPLPEQRAIAHILGTLDDKIELNRRMSKTLEEMARAIFKSWFVDFDPVRAKAAVRREHPNWTNAQVSRAALPTLKPEISELFPDDFVDSEQGMIPKGWRVKSFTDNVDVFGGGTPKTSTPEYWGGRIPWFSVVDTPAEGEIFVISTEKTLTQEGINNSSTRVLPVGTTIITARGTVGNIALVGIPMAMNQSCYGLHDLRGNKGYFLYFFTKSIVETLKQRTHGSVFNTITRDTLKSMRVVSPPSELISKFEGTVGTMLERNLSNLHESHILATCRDILLPKLISGTLRVEDAESFIKETI